MQLIRTPALLALAILISCSGAAWSQALVAESTAERVTLIELYTSEGCSSCPSADQWLRQLRSQPGLWDRFVPVGFHVDYWNYLGWRDRFSDARFSSRQRLYARLGRTSAVYTPGFIKNGREWRPAKGWQPSSQPSPRNPGVLRILADADRVYLEFEPETDLAGDLTAHVALLGFDLETAVKRGENSGRTLQHDFVVLAFESVQLEADSARWRAQMARPASAIKSPGYALAAWITGQDRLEGLQAAGGWLIDPARPASSPQASR